MPLTGSRTVPRVLGIDTALRSTGIGIVEARGSALQLITFGCIRAAAHSPLSKCLEGLYTGVQAAIADTAPTAAAVEGVFYCKNVKTAVILGQARGTVIAACARNGLPVFEYAPRRVKQAVVGFGAADKSQVRRMVMSLLGLASEPPEDAADALAVAICHLHNRGRRPELAPTPI